MKYFTIVVSKAGNINGLFTSTVEDDDEWQGYTFEEEFDVVEELGLTLLSNSENSGGLFSKRYVAAYVARTTTNKPMFVCIPQKGLDLDIHYLKERVDDNG